MQSVRDPFETVSEWLRRAWNAAEDHDARTALQCVGQMLPTLTQAACEELDEERAAMLLSARVARAAILPTRQD